MELSDKTYLHITSNEMARLAVVAKLRSKLIVKIYMTASARGGVGCGLFLIVIYGALLGVKASGFFAPK